MEKNKSSQQIIKESNMKMVFGLIHKHQTISRADIKKITALSATTVSSLVEELIEEGVVVECGMKETKTIGRKAIMLKINSEGGFFIGLDVRKNCVSAALYGLDFSLIETINLPLSNEKISVLRIIRDIAQLADGKRILGVTIGIPGIIDPKTNNIISSTVLAIEDVKEMVLKLKEAMPDVNVFIKNNSGLIALCEKEFGGYDNVSNLVSVDIYDGVGAGILIDGVIYDGGGFAGEFGHITLDLNGERCSCGSYGCLELYSSVPAILEKTKLSSLEELRLELDRNDRKATSDLFEITRALAFGINNIVNLLDPEYIIIGGSVKVLGDVFLDMLKQHLSTISVIKEKNIVFSSISENPVILGGVRYAFDMVFGM